MGQPGWAELLLKASGVPGEGTSFLLSHTWIASALVWVEVEAESALGEKEGELQWPQEQGNSSPTAGELLSPRAAFGRWPSLPKVAEGPKIWPCMTSGKSLCLETVFLSVKPDDPCRHFLPSQSSHDYESSLYRCGSVATSMRTGTCLGSHEITNEPK
jgi:hypothetical protein